MARRTRAAARPRKGAHQARRRARAATTQAAVGAGGEGVPLRHGRRREAAGRALRWTIAAARLPLRVRPELRGRLPDLFVDGRRHRRPASSPARPRRDVRIRLTSTAREAAGLQAPHGLEYSLGLYRTHRLQLRPRLLEQRTADARVGRADGRAAAAHPRPQRRLYWDGSRWLPHGTV